MGRQYRFSEFLCLSFGEFCQELPSIERRRWQEFSTRFAKYTELSVSDRASLVAEARRYLFQLQKNAERALEEPPAPKVPRTASLIAQQPRDPYGRVALDLHQALSKIKDIGPRNAKQLERLGLLTVRDLLFYYPRDHINYARQVPIDQLVPGETVTIVGTVKRCSCFTSPKNSKLTILEIVLKDHTGKLRLSRFYAGNRYSNRGWQETTKRKYIEGAVVAASGLVKDNGYGVSLDNPELEVLGHIGDTIESLKIGRVLPVYGLSEGIGADLVRKAVLAVLPAAKQLKDPLPAGSRDRYGLTDLPTALQNIHFPEDEEALSRARRRLVFDEFFYLQLGFLQRREILRESQTRAVMVPQGQLVDQFQHVLPFKFTNAQHRVIQDILKDLSASKPMNRLVQGDVGSGKTVVAVVAILAAIQSGYQAALMAPTEVLAEQHYRKIVSWFNLLHLPVELLTGSTKTKKRREIHAHLETGELPLLVGTHALIQDPVNFRKLGLVVIDEQHRFGVQQRARLLSKGEAPHVLTMTATPIPRTLALTLHGDLDVSQIDEMPPGRQPIQTTVLSSQQRSQAYDLMRREIVQGRQIYVVLPLVEESEKLDLKSAIEEHQRLSETIFPEFQVGLLHGRMTSEEKDAAITQFRDRKTQILVSTTVVEVGVDVPNATVMMIEHAERFGLSQLHQLRGRVGRGSHKSYCLLVSSSKSPESRQRLEVLAQSQDGFFIAEMDLRMRGPGEVLGTRQSGVADFALASLVEDQEVLLLAREAAEKAIALDPTLNQWPKMKAELDDRYQKLMGGRILT